MSKKLFIILLIVVTIINLSATATIMYERWSRKDFSRSMMIPGDEAERFLRDRLDLKPEQIDSMKASMDKFMESVQEPMEKFGDLREKLFRKINEDSTNLDSIHQIIDLMGEIQTRIRRESVDQLLRDKNYLPPRQHQQIIELFMRHLGGEFNRPIFNRMRNFRHGRGKPGKHFQDDSIRKYRNRNQTNQNNGGSL